MGMSLNLAVDCGAGIGRITGGLLLPVFEAVDMVDTCSEHLDAAREYLVGLVLIAIILCDLISKKRSKKVFFSNLK